MPWRTVESFPKSQLLADSTIVRNSSLHPLSAPSQSLLSATCPFSSLAQTTVLSGLSASSSHSCNLDYTIFLELSSHPIRPLLKTLKRPPKFKVSLVMVMAEPPWALPSDCHPLPPAPTASGPLFESAGPLPLSWQLAGTGLTSPIETANVLFLYIAIIPRKVSTHLSLKLLEGRGSIATARP